MTVNVSDIKTGNVYEVPVKGMGSQSLTVGRIDNGIALCVFLELEDTCLFTLPTSELAKIIIREVPMLEFEEPQ